MTDPAQHQESNESEQGPLHREPVEHKTLVIESSSLFRGRREVWIRHGVEMYRLRLTSSGKLYLSK